LLEQPDGGSNDPSGPLRSPDRVRSRGDAMTKTRWTGLIAGILLLASASTARASNFTLNQPSYPDLTGYEVNISYKHSTGVLTACGYTTTLTTGATTSYAANSVPCQYSLRALIFESTATSPVVFTANNASTYDTAHCLPATTKSAASGAGSTDTSTCTSSSMAISGGFPTYDTNPSLAGTQPIANNSLLFDGNLTDFNFTGGSQSTNTPTVLRFLVAVMDDPQHLGFGTLAGAVLTTTDIYIANFSKDFSGHGYIDTFRQTVGLQSVPEPATIILLGTGTAALFRRRRSSTRRSAAA
jgi:hypothetical protein